MRFIETDLHLPVWSYKKGANTGPLHEDA
jgi:hypothetical protein